jgi:toxin ParE1/3/4
MRIRLIAAAKGDMVRIWAYYEKKRPGLGDEFLDELGEAVRQVREFPNAAPEFWKGTRRIVLKRFPYGAAYRIDGDDIQLIVIAHLSRASRVWRKRL